MSGDIRSVQFEAPFARETVGAVRKLVLLIIIPNN